MIYIYLCTYLVVLFVEIKDLSVEKMESEEIVSRLVRNYELL